MLNDRLAHGIKGNGTVPKYLRKQIMEARVKLALLKEKANKAQQDTGSANTNGKRN
jgi:hypothetical protein